MKHTPRLPKSNAIVTLTSMLREFFVLTLSLPGIVIATYADEFVRNMLNFADGNVAGAIYFFKRLPIFIFRWGT